MSAVPTTSAPRIAPPIAFRNTARKLPDQLAKEAVGADVGRPYAFQPVCVERPGAHAYCEPTAWEWGDGEPGDLVTVYPFEFVLPFACNGPVEGDLEVELLAEQRDRIEKATDFVLANEAWAPAARIANPDDPAPLSLVMNGTLAVGSPSSMAEGFAALLEVRYGPTGSVNVTTGGVWHVPPQLIPAALAETQIVQVGNRYVGPMGFDVIADLGYAPVAHIGPGGTPDAGYFMWLSGPVRYAISDIYVDPEDPTMRRANPRTNRYHVWAHRRAVVEVDPCDIVGIPVTFA